MVTPSLSTRLLRCRILSNHWKPRMLRDSRLLAAAQSRTVLAITTPSRKEVEQVPPQNPPRNACERSGEMNSITLVPMSLTMKKRNHGSLTKSLAHWDPAVSLPTWSHLGASRTGQRVRLATNRTVPTAHTSPIGRRLDAAKRLRANLSTVETVEIAATLIDPHGPISVKCRNRAEASPMTCFVSKCN